MSMKHQAFSAVRWTALGVATKAGLQFLQLVVLARLLTSAQLGMMSLMMSMTMFITMFVDMGVSNALMHEKEIGVRERTSLYWLNVVVGLVFSTFLAAASPWIADFYQEPALAEALWIISPYFLVYSLGQQLKVMAEKELRFKPLIAIEASAAIVGFMLTIGMAAAGAGVNAVATGFVATALVFSLLGWKYLSDGWRPGWRFEPALVGKYVRYGSYVIGNNLVSSVNGTADVFMGGRVLGFAPLSTFSLPRDLMLNVASVINAVVTRVGFPLMAKAQDDPLRLRRAYLTTVKMTASVNAPVYLAMFAFADDVVRIVFGESRLDMVPTLQILALWGLSRSFGQPAGSLVFAVGRADLAYKWNFAWMPIIVCGLWLGLQYSVSGLAYALLTLSLIGQIPNWRILVQPLCGAGFCEYFMEILRPCFAAGVAIGLTWWLVDGIAGASLRLSAAALIGCLAYLAVSYVVNREWVTYMFQMLLPQSSEPNQ